MAVQKSGSASSPSHLRLVAAPPGVPAGRRAAGARARPRSEPGRMLTSCVAPLSTVRYGLNPGRNLEQIPKVAKPSQRKGRQSQKNILVRGVIREVSPPHPDPRGSSSWISPRTQPAWTCAALSTQRLLRCPSAGLSCPGSGREETLQPADCRCRPAARRSSRFRWSGGRGLPSSPPGPAVVSPGHVWAKAARMEQEWAGTGRVEVGSELSRSGQGADPPVVPPSLPTLLAPVLRPTRLSHTLGCRLLALREACHGAPPELQGQEGAQAHQEARAYKLRLLSASGHAERVGS